MPKSSQYFRHSVSTNVAVVVIGFVSFSASIVRAGSITYSLIDYGNYHENGYTLHGSITTDGKMGQLSPTDITAWNISLEQAGSSAPLFPINPANTFVRAASGVVATAARQIDGMRRDRGTGSTIVPDPCLILHDFGNAPDRERQRRIQ